MKIRLLGVRMSNFTDPYVQESLFLDPIDEKREKVHKAVDLIKDKFGEGAIYRARNAWKTMRSKVAGEFDNLTWRNRQMTYNGDKINSIQRGFS